MTRITCSMHTAMVSKCIQSGPAVCLQLLKYATLLQYQWRRNEINIAGARRGPKIEARMAEPGVVFLGKG